MNAQSAGVAEACAREPIHIPGAIQPHGALLVVALEDGVIRHASENFPELTGRRMPIDSTLTDVLPAELADEISAAFAQESFPLGPLPVSLPTGEFQITAQRSGGGVGLLEFEPAEAATALRLSSLHGALITELQTARDVPGLCRTTAQAVARLSGFDRVMAYRFHDDWHGEVIAEVCAPGLDPYLGLHYPATDIPEQARRLYTLNWSRLIVTADYEPVPLTPAPSRPIDLTHSALRSVSPVHLEYLRNMGVAASMSVSLIRGGRLWGLIACHHRSPRLVGSAVRMACELIGRTASALLEAKEEAARQAVRVDAKSVQSRIFERLGEETTFSAALLNYAGDFLDFARARGAALVSGDKVRSVGEVPSVAFVEECARFLREQSDELIFSTEHLAGCLPSARFCETSASGLLAIALNETRTDWLLWFRPAVSRTVEWAGNPQREIADLSLPIQPRKSFAIWTQEVRGHSEPWSELDHAAALELRAAINASILKRTEKLLALNEELQRKNTDLDSFAYIASHDLREPLRGIRNYLEFLHEDLGNTIAPEHSERIAATSRMADRLHDMLEALLHFTRVSRAATPRTKVAVGPIVARALELVGPKIQENQALVTVAPDLPPAACDPLMAAEVFANLISNGLKYNQSAPKRIEISFAAQPDGGVAYFVRDNGIGIRERNRADVFQLFRRLHPGNSFGGGIGAGLAIVKAIVEQHGGRVWLESEENHGTSVFFRFDSEDR